MRLLRLNCFLWVGEGEESRQGSEAGMLTVSDSAKTPIVG